MRCSDSLHSAAYVYHGSHADAAIEVLHKTDVVAVQFVSRETQHFADKAKFQELQRWSWNIAPS